MNLDQIIPSLLIPGWLTCLFAFTAGLIKIREYRGAYDWTVVLSIVARFAIAFIVLADPEVFTPRVILFRFAVTLLFLSEDARQLLKLAGRNYKRS